MWTAKRSRTRNIGLTAILTVVFGGPAYGQEPAKDDGVTIITQKDADKTGFPVTISEAGSYRLGSNLVPPDANTTAIEIVVPGVTLDLNGFRVSSPGGQGAADVDGIRATGQNTAVLNGRVIGFAGGYGVAIFAPGCRVEGVHAAFNRVGMHAGFSCMVLNNLVNVNRSEGIVTGNGSTVIGNTANSNGGVGMSLGLKVGYSNNVLTGNNGGDANPQVTGGIQMGGNVCGNTLCP